jgi:hypothetical protein
MRPRTVAIRSWSVPVRHLVFSLVIPASVLLLAAPVAAQHAYPAKGQSAATQAKDESACSQWATGKTGYDPAHPPQPAVAQPSPVTGSGARVRGAARGAVIGGVITGDAGRGAATGAVVGGVRQRVGNRRAADAQNQATAQQVEAAHAAYVQARSSCLSGRGYSVK